MVDDNNNDAGVFDFTNMFHWCPAPSFDSVILVGTNVITSVVPELPEDMAF